MSRLSSRRTRRLALGALAVVLVASAINIRRVGAQDVDEAGDDLVEVILFYSDGCPYCAQAREFLSELPEAVEGIVVAEYEVSAHAANRDLFRELASGLGFEARAVPTTIIGDQHWVGFNDSVAVQLRAAVEALVGGRDVDPATRPVIAVPGVGDVDLDDRSLLVSTLLIGFVDGFNPCSLWVLSLLLALVLHSGSRRRVVAVGSVFLVITTVLYGLFIVGIYSVLSYVAYLTWIQRVVALIAAGFAVVNIKDYFWFGRGVSLSIGEERKPGLYRRMRALGRPEQPLWGVLAGTAALAIGVSLVETPCTAGFPVIWTNLLAARDVDAASAVLLFLVYMIVFLIDELVVFGAAVFTMRAAKVQEEHGRFLKLLAGVVMLALAATMLLDPDLLTGLGGTILVFGSAFVIAQVISWAHHRMTTASGMAPPRVG